MALKFVDEIDVEGKRVIARFDFNVPLEKGNPKKISDTTRIDRALPTIRLLLEQGCSKLVLMSHLGRPKGKVVNEYSLEPVATYLASQLKEEVLLTESCLDRGIKTVLNLNETKIILLQNLRFHPEETNNDHEFARKISEYGDIYVNDAFGTAHRKHASTYEINSFFKGQAVGGLLLKKEIFALEKIIHSPERPFIAITGGAKVSDKIKIIEKLLPNVSSLIIGGAMAYSFLKAKGKSIGNSLHSDEDIELARRILQSSSASKILLPIDHIISDSPNGQPQEIGQEDIPEGQMGLDIGPSSLHLFESKLKEAKTVLWNGPMGLFENADFSKGTFGMAKILSELSAFTLIGGGDSVSAVVQANLDQKMGHISTGGGATLEFIEQGQLPGIQALRFGL